VEVLIGLWVKIRRPRAWKYSNRPSGCGGLERVVVRVGVGIGSPSAVWNGVCFCSVVVGRRAGRRWSVDVQGWR